MSKVRLHRQILLVFCHPDYMLSIGLATWVDISDCICFLLQGDHILWLYLFHLSFVLFVLNIEFYANMLLFLHVILKSILDVLHAYCVSFNFGLNRLLTCPYVTPSAKEKLYFLVIAYFLQRSILMSNLFFCVLKTSPPIQAHALEDLFKLH